jgi:hypothetical protein
MPIAIRVPTAGADLVACFFSVVAGCMLVACSTENSGQSPADGGAGAGDAYASHDALDVADSAVADSTASDATAAAEAGPTTDGSPANEDGSSDGGGDAAEGGCDVRDGGIPDDLRCTGLYSDWATQTVAADVYYYDPGYKLWSDGAVKRRWIWLPPQTQIDTSNMDEWVFPVGTKIWKEFSLGSQLGSDGQLTGGSRVETRLLWKKSAGSWGYAVYRWSDDQSSAKSITTGDHVAQPDGPPDYEVPATIQCPNCHGGRTDVVLGFDWIGLGVATAGATGGLTLATLPAGWLTQPPPATNVAIPEDATGKAAAALGLLHMNCGVSCHNVNGKAGYTGLYMKLLAGQVYPEGGAGSVTDLDTYTTAVNVPGHLDFGKYLRIAPGDSANSLVPLMALSRDADAGPFLPMPPLLSHRPDTDPTTGIPLVQAWIDALQ